MKDQKSRNRPHRRRARPLLIAVGAAAASLALPGCGHHLGSIAMQPDAAAPGVTVQMPDMSAKDLEPSTD